KSLEELIEVARELEVKSDKLDRAISIVYFYIGKIFYEKMEEFYSEKSLVGEQKNQKILTRSNSVSSCSQWLKNQMATSSHLNPLGVDGHEEIDFLRSLTKIHIPTSKEDDNKRLWFAADHQILSVTKYQKRKR
ncbi:13268_t:CDS:2, partial [Acaulospora morrowiae]